MTVKIVSSDTDGLVLEVKIPLGTVMLDGEERIEQALNEAGAVVSGELLKRFDTDGSAIQVGDTKLTSKGLMEKTYQTPYGETRISRHVYQTAQGGFHVLPTGIQRQNHSERDAKTGEDAVAQILQTEC